MHLLVCTDDPDKAISFMMGVVKLDVEFPDSVFEMPDFTA
jgi:hypothetical protein